MTTPVIGPSGESAGEVARLWDRARAQHQQGALPAAVTEYRALLALQPDHEGALHLLALAEHQSGDNAAAVKRLEQALALAPNRSEHYTLMALVRLAMGEREAALTDFLKADELAPGRAETQFNLGKVLQSLGRFREAAAAYRRAIEIDPGDVKSHNNLGNILREMEDLEGAVACYEAALERRPNATGLLMNLGLTRHRQGDLDGALEIYHKALRAAPEEAALHCNLADVLRDKGDYATAEATYVRALERDPSATNTLLGLGHNRLANGDAEGALTVLNQCLQNNPKNQRALSYKAIAQQALGLTLHAQSILDLDRDVVTMELPLPSGYPSRTDFAAALVEDLCSNSTIEWHEKTGRATRNGTHSKNLYEIPTERVREMIESLERAIADYAANLDRDTGHPHRAHVPDRYRIDVWAVRMRSGGHQISHIHPAGWLSGVTYLQIPEAVSQAESDNQGWIEFGRPGYNLPSPQDSPTRQIRPVVGQVLVFPSYAFHRTVPYESTTERISLAFDVVPLA